MTDRISAIGEPAAPAELLQLLQSLSSPEPQGGGGAQQAADPALLLMQLQLLSRFAGDGGADPGAGFSATPQAELVGRELDQVSDSAMEVRIT